MWMRHLNLLSELPTYLISWIGSLVSSRLTSIIINLSTLRLEHEGRCSGLLLNPAQRTLQHRQRHNKLQSAEAAALTPGPW